MCAVGRGSTIDRRRKWAADGTWAKAFTDLLAQADAEGDLASVVPVDSTIVHAHQHATGAHQKGSQGSTARVCRRGCCRYGA